MLTDESANTERDIGRGKHLRDKFGLLTPADLSALRGIDERTLAVERCTGRGPDYVKLGRRVFYREEDITAWLRLNIVQTDRAA